MKQTQEQSNKYNKQPIRERVYVYIKHNPGKTLDQICDGLGISTKNSGRLTELEKTGYIMSVINIDTNKSLYYVKDENRPYFHLDFKGEAKQMMSIDKKLGDELGFFLVNLKNDKLTVEDKKLLVNDLLKIYTKYLFQSQKQKHTIDEIKVLHNKLGVMLDVEDMKID